MEPSPLPTFLYKILDHNSPPPSPLPERLPETPLDAKDGFIHLSMAAQIPFTARLFFADAPALYLLQLTRTALDGRIEWTTDKSNGAVPHGCPHLHGSVRGLGSDNIASVIHVSRPPGQDWAANAVLRALES